MTTTTPARPGDFLSDEHLTGPFAPVVAEVDVAGLEVSGELPADLAGAYLRNGPNPRFAPIGSFVYPLDGDGMVHRVTVEDGRARYDNRFVRTPMVVAEEDAGHALWPGFTSGVRPDAAQVGPALAGTVRRTPDINVVRHGGHLLALAECQPPYALDERLGTLGPFTFDGTLPGGVCAHPKIDPATGEMLVFAYRFDAPFLTWTSIARDGTAHPMRPVEGVERPSMIHDMAITPHHVVLVVAPLFFDLRAAVSGGSLLAWEPERGTRVALVPRDGGPVRWFRDEAFWMWHAANAHERDDGTVVLDYVEWPSPGLILPGAGGGSSHLARAVLDPAAGTLRRAQLDDTRIEFARIDDRLVGRAQPVSAVAVHTGRPTPHPGCHDGLAWYDTRTDAVVQWRPDDLAVGEPVFAPDPRSDAPDRGWWVTFTTRFSTGTSAMVVIPAADPAAGPVAEIRMPVRVPLGLHGSWLPAP